MPVAPLFIANRATLDATLRLTGIPDGTDAEAIVGQAILQARMEFVRVLTKERVAVLVAYTYTETPTTDEENLRLLANLTESMLVRLHLMRTLPVMFMDTAEKDQQAWNDEGLFRNKSPFDLEREKTSLLTDIDNNMDLLAGDETPGEESDLKIKTMSPETTPPRPGDSIWGSRQQPWSSS